MVLIEGSFYFGMAVSVLTPRSLDISSTFNFRGMTTCFIDFIQTINFMVSMEMLMCNTCRSQATFSPPPWPGYEAAP